MAETGFTDAQYAKFFDASVEGTFGYELAQVNLNNTI